MSTSKCPVKNSVVGFEVELGIQIHDIRYSIPKNRLDLQ